MTDTKNINDIESSFYVFDIEKLKKRIAYLRSSLPADISVCYAVKANTFIIKEIENDVERFEVCSPGEAEICKNLKIEKEKIVISGVYKTPRFIEEIIADKDFDGIFTVESLTQFNLFCTLSEKYNRKIRVLLRLTNDSQFGINEQDIINIIGQRQLYPNIKLLGIQYFSGTQKTSVRKIRRELLYLDKFLLDLQDNYDFKAEELEYGTGFTVEYFGDNAFDEDEYFKEVSAVLNSLSSKPAITLEIGRSIVASCGRYYTHIVDIKENKNQNYLVTDGGMHQIVYFGQYMGMKKPAVSVLNKKEPDAEKSWIICGSLCSMNDIMVKQIQLPCVEIGDTLCFENAGAYCMTEGISLFLSRDIPKIYLLKNDCLVCVRESFETQQLNYPNYERE